MTTLQYEDSGYREKQQQKEKDEFAIAFAEWIDINFIKPNPWENLKNIKGLLERYKKEKGL
jgi:hypothetical protein